MPGSLRDSMDFQADVAQSVEHSLGKGEVTGSIPVISSSFVVGMCWDERELISNRNDKHQLQIFVVGVRPYGTANSGAFTGCGKTLVWV